MKKAVILFFSCLYVCCLAENVVVRHDFDVPSGWNCPLIQGRDFWFILPQSLSNNGDLSKLEPPFRNPALQKVPVFRDGGMIQGAFKRWNSIPKPFVMKDLFYSSGNPWWNLLESNPKKHVPLMIFSGAVVQANFTGNHFKHDQADYQAFLKRHPNFYMFLSLSEWDNVLVHYDTSMFRNSPEQQKLAFKHYPPPKNRYEFLKTARKYYESEVNFYFDDRSRISAMRAGWALDHVAAAYGAKMLGLETTNTTAGLASYRWQTSGYFIRGAARQFNLPWLWYVAHFYNGYNSKGKWRPHHVLYYAPMKTANSIRGPQLGPSPSNLKRVNWMSWLYGASINTIEGAAGALTVQDKKTGLLELSQVGKDYNELYLATTKIDRGVPYTPGALLIPFAQGYPQGGGNAWGRYKYEPGDMMIDAFTFTLVPPGGNRHDLMKKGIECTLFNTPFASAYDVLTPDSPQNTADFVRAASAYKVAFLTGSYKPGTDLETPLAGYVRNGGTLFVNAMQIQGFLSSKLTGVKVGSNSIPAGKFIVDETGRKTDLKDTHKLRQIELKGAKPWLRDEKGNILAVSYPCGKGKVIVTTPEWMAPRLKKETLTNILTGKQTFEFIKYLLGRVEDEAFPVKAKVPVQYGINKTKNGWLLWLINNKGVYKLVDVPAVVKPEERITVPVELKSLAKLKAEDALTGKKLPVVNGILKVTVEPGDLRLVKLIP